MEELNKEQFKQWLEIKRLSPKTIQLYMYYWGKFDTQQLTQQYILQYLERYKNPVARAFTKNLIQWIKTNEFSKELKDKINYFEIPKVTGRRKKRIPEIINETQARQISDNMPDLKGQLMVLLGFYCGLRVNEMITIKPYDFKWDAWLKNPDDQATLKIIGKGNKQRNIYVPNFIMKLVYHHVKLISTVQAKDDPVFRTNTRTFEYHLGHVSTKTIGRHIHPHLLRHSAGSFLHEKGMEIKEIKEYLGHDSINTTDRYITITNKNLEEKYKQVFK